MRIVPDAVLRMEQAEMLRVGVRICRALAAYLSSREVASPPAQASLV